MCTKLDSAKCRLLNTAGSSELPEKHDTPSLQFPVWRDEKMHQLVTTAAMSAADALVESGRPIRTGQHVMLRADIIVTHQYDKVRTCSVSSALEMLPSELVVADDAHLSGCTTGTIVALSPPPSPSIHT